MRMTAERIRKIGGCAECSGFFERAGLANIDLAQVREVDMTRHIEWVEWLASRIKLHITRAGVNHYEYDDRNNRISETYPNGGVWRYKYDDRGNLVSVTHPDGEVCRYDPLDPITITLTMADGSTIVRTA